MLKVLSASAAVSAMAIFTLPVRADLSPQDKQFVAAAASGGTLEVRLGEYASQNAASEDVKKFAEHMVGDHRQGNDQLRTIATEKPIEIPKEMSAEDKRVLNQLETLKGSQFDTAYVGQMVEDHKKDVAAFEQEIAAGTDVAVKSFAEKMLPILKHHLEMAEELQRHLKR